MINPQDINLKELEEQSIGKLKSMIEGSDKIYNIIVVENVKQIISDKLNSLKQKANCESRVGLHICEKYPEDCYLMVEWNDVIKIFTKQ